MKQFRVAMLGYGIAGKAFARILNQTHDDILAKTGFDVDKALANAAPDAEDLGQVEAPTATRRVQPASTPGRRTEGKYKIVTPKTEEVKE